MKPFDPLGACLYCNDAVQNFEPGPRGGASQNMTCRRCGARYNLVVLARGGAPLQGVPLFLEVLGEPKTTIEKPFFRVFQIGPEKRRNARVWIVRNSSRRSAALGGNLGHF